MSDSLTISKKYLQGTSRDVVTFTDTRETLGGQLTQARPASWVSVETQRFSFILGDAEKQTFEAFAIANAGKYVLLTVEGFEQDGMITPSLVSFQRIGWTCPLWNISFDFEVRL